MAAPEAERSRASSACCWWCRWSRPTWRGGRPRPQRWTPRRGCRESVLKRSVSWRWRAQKEAANAQATAPRDREREVPAAS